MKRYIHFAAGLVAMSLCVGCGLLGLLADQIQPKTVTVRLVNDGDYAVEVELFIADNQDLPEDVLTEIGTELNFTIPAGESAVFSRRCDDLQAIVIDKATLMVIGGNGPDASSDVLRDGTDFGCGETIVFTFEHSDVILDFHVTVDVQSE